MATKNEGAPPKTIDHTITYGGALILKGALARPGWYKDDHAKLIPAVAVIENHLCDKANVEVEKEETQADYDKRSDPILSAAVDLALTQSEREACQTAVQALLKQGALPVNKHTVTLMRELEID